MAEDKKKEIDVTVIEVTEEYLKEKLYKIRGKRVLLDADLAEIYGYDTKGFNRQVKNNIEKLYFAFLKKNVSRIVNHYPRLTKKEQAVLQCLLKNGGINEIKSQLKIEEKTLSCYQSKITRKFGCKRYIRFMYLYSLNKEMVDERWLMPSI